MRVVCAGCARSCARPSLPPPPSLPPLPLNGHNVCKPTGTILTNSMSGCAPVTSFWGMRGVPRETFDKSGYVRVWVVIRTCIYKRYDTHVFRAAAALGWDRTCPNQGLPQPSVGTSLRGVIACSPFDSAQRTRKKR